MQIADAMFTDTFTFKLTYKSFYGAWVDEIDGVADTADSVWMLYIDDVSSCYGISDTILRVSPPAYHVEVSWKYQKFHLAESTQLTRKLSVFGRE